jgi:hypothetical protein
MVLLQDDGGHDSGPLEIHLARTTVQVRNKLGLSVACRAPTVAWRSAVERDGSHSRGLSRDTTVSVSEDTARYGRLANAGPCRSTLSELALLATTLQKRARSAVHT